MFAAGSLHDWLVRASMRHSTHSLRWRLNASKCDRMYSSISGIWYSISNGNMNNGRRARTLQSKQKTRNPTERTTNDNEKKCPKSSRRTKKSTISNQCMHINCFVKILFVLLFTMSAYSYGNGCHNFWPIYSCAYYALSPFWSAWPPDRTLPLANTMRNYCFRLQLFY